MTDRLDAVLLPLLACPTCHSPLTRRPAGLECSNSHTYSIVRGVPVFTSDGPDVEVRPEEHVSHQPSPEILAAFANAPGPWLHLGAGATTERYAGSVELETAVFRNTDVIGDASRLPFADHTLGGVLALNVFEHLADP